MVEFPVQGVAHKKLHSSLLRATTGGRFGRDSANHVTVRAIDSINLDIASGDRIGLVGHNGSGKSTLLKVFAGVYEPVSGNIRVNGNVGSLIGMMLGMDPESTGYENIRLRGLLMGFTRKEIDKITSEIVEFADIGDYIHMPLRIYSSGMALRLAFAVATAGKTDILLMDEWVGVGDAEFHERSERRLSERIRSAKILVMSAHDEALIEKHCNRVIRLDQGKIVSDSR